MARERYGETHDLPPVGPVDFGDWNWTVIKLRNRRVHVGKHKELDDTLIFFTRLGKLDEPRIITSNVSLSNEAADALGFLLTKPTT